MSYGYQDTNHFHAVTHLDSVQKYWYDANGNMTDRIVGSDSYDLTYDADNRLVEVEKNQTTVGEYVYDGDGSRVKSVVNGVTTYYIGNYFEWRVETSGSTGVKYYYAGSQRVAMRVGATLSYLFGDHLGSTSITADASGNVSGELRYLPFGETRYENGQTPTSFRYTGQREAAESGLYFYGARWYDSALGRFIQADTIIPSPGNPMAWDRYAYVLNNPLRLVDPSGHYYCEGSLDCEHNIYHTYTGDQLLDEVFSDYGVTLTGGWTSHNKYAAALGITAVGAKLAKETGKTSSEAFQEVYGEMWFEWNAECPGCRSAEKNASCGSNFSGDCGAGGAVIISGHHIQFASMSSNTLSAQNHVVHELGHAINHALGGRPYEEMSSALTSNPQLARLNTTENYGFASSGFEWQQAVVDVDKYWEIWADQFLGWVFNKWETDGGGNLTSQAQARSS